MVNSDLQYKTMDRDMSSGFAMIIDIDRRSFTSQRTGGVKNLNIISDALNVTYDVTYGKALNITEQTVLAVLKQR